MTADQSAPLFLVGTGRCGSTIVYSCLAMHPSLAWIPSWLTTAPRWPVLAAANRFWELPGTDRWREARFFPKPVEPNTVWERWVPEFHREDARPDAVAQTQATLVPLVDRVKRYHGKPRYLGKLVGRPVKIELLASVFPEARFVHVTRDLKPTVSSLLLVDFFQNNAPLERWPWGTIPAALLDFYRANGSAQEVAAAITVVLNRVEVERQLGRLAADRWIEVSYTGFIGRPIEEMRRICRHADLSIDARFEQRIQGREIHGGDDRKWARHLTAEQVARLDAFEPLAADVLRGRPVLTATPR